MSIKNNNMQLQTSETSQISENNLSKSVEALKNNGFNVVVVNSKEEAFELLKKSIPAGAEVMTGSSTTLMEIGFMDYYLSNQHLWKNLGSPIYLEQNPVKKYKMRRESVTAEYFLASVNAITEDGKLVAVDGSGSRVGAYPFGAEKLILVSGINKIVPTLNDAFDRIKNVVYPLEDQRAQKRYGGHARFGKWVIIERENVKDRINLILVKESLGF